MYFYLKPPTGTVPLYRLYEFAIRRLVFLMKLMSLRENPIDISCLLEQDGEVESSECLIEGTAKDRISHFILRLTFLSSHEQQAFLIEAETFLFRIRLQQMSMKEKCKMMRVIERHLLELDVCHNPDSIFSIIYSVIQQLKHIYSRKRHSFTPLNTKYLIQVPFQHALPLVSSRSVYLSHGKAFVSPSEVNTLLEFLFSQHLTHEMKSTHSKCLEICNQDQRIEDLCEKLEGIFLKNESWRTKLSHFEKGSLSLKEIDSESNHFPPCMRFLHEKLRHCHRLKHSARVEYTLFLKEIGLSVSDAISFWKKEYSKPHSNCHSAEKSSSCTHHWDVDKHRYIYGIRHLYGLEGSRRNYIAHSCSLLQSKTLGPLEQGGCPFKHFDIDKLPFHLKKWGMNELNANILTSLSTMQQFKKACSVYQAFMTSDENTLKRNVTSIPSELILQNDDQNTQRLYSLLQENNVLQVAEVNDATHDSKDNIKLDSSFEFINRLCNSFAKPSEFYHLVKHNWSDCES